MTDTHGQHAPCHARYERSGGAQPGDRIVKCALAAGHDGEHEEAYTRITWPAAPAEPRHDQGDAADVRARQIQAALTAMRAHEVEWCCHPASLAAELVDAVNAAGDPTACPACPTQPHDEPDRPHVHATPYGYAIYAPGGLAFVDELRAAGYRDAIEALRDRTGERFQPWFDALPAEERFTYLDRDYLADYLEAVGPQRDAQRPETAPDGTDRAGEDAGNGGAETGGSGTL